MAKLEITITPRARAFIQEQGDSVLLAESRNSMIG